MQSGTVAGIKITLPGMILYFIWISGETNQDYKLPRGTFHLQVRFRNGMVALKFFLVFKMFFRWKRFLSVDKEDEDNFSLRDGQCIGMDRR